MHSSSEVGIEEEVDSTLLHSIKLGKRRPSIDALNSEMPSREYQKDSSKRLIKVFLNKLRLRKCASATISRPDPIYKVAYLGNVVTGWAKGDGCVEKPLATLWRNYTHSSRPDVKMTLSVSNGGLKATTRDHGLTEYWAHRLTFCAAPDQFPRLFCWVYRHEGRRLRHELRCHAVLCSTASIAKKIETELNQALAVALAEFRKDKISKQNARLSLANSVYENPTIPRRKIMLSTGSNNYRPPLERSKSAPKLTMIEESLLEEEDTEVNSNTSKSSRVNNYKRFESVSYSFDRRKRILRDVQSKYYKNSLDRISTIATTTVRESCDKKEKAQQPPQLLTKPDLTENLSEEYEEDNKTDLILDSLLKNQMKNDLLESCERAWFNALGDKPDLIPLDSDEGSLSSGCESASTINSEMDQPIFPIIEEEELSKVENKKTELDFKVGGSVLARVMGFESGSAAEGLKCRILNSNNSGNISPMFNTNGNAGNNVLGCEEVSLVPVGETQSDFSSLKVFKRRPIGGDRSCCSESDLRLAKSEDDSVSSYSDESGYEEEEIASSIANVILV